MTATAFVPLERAVHPAVLEMLAGHPSLTRLSLHTLDLDPEDVGRLLAARRPILPSLTRLTARTAAAAAAALLPRLAALKSATMVVTTVSEATFLRDVARAKGLEVLRLSFDAAQVFSAAQVAVLRALRGLRLLSLARYQNHPFWLRSEFDRRAIYSAFEASDGLPIDHRPSWLEAQDFDNDEFVALAHSLAAMELLELRLERTSVTPVALRRIGGVARRLVLLRISYAVDIAAVLDSDGVLFPCLRELSGKSWGDYHE
jgi:hypothetical protein